MLTAAITAGIAGLLSLFGVKPGSYLVGVAIGVKVVLVAIGVVFGARFVRRRAKVESVESKEKSVEKSEVK